MDHHRIFGHRRLGLAAAVGLAIGLTTTGTAGATGSAGSAFVVGDTLAVIGTARADDVVLRLAPGAPNTLQVDFGDDGTAEASFDRSTFTRINVFLRAGADQLRVDQVNGAFADEALTAIAGSGADTILGGDGNDLVFGGSGNDSFDGNRGVDTASFGTGHDTFVWDPGDGSDALEGGPGTDRLLFNGANGNETMALSANGRASVFLREPGAIRMDMDGVEVVDVVALGGADSITVNDLRGTQIRRANLDLSVQGVGDGQPDVVTVEGTAAADRVSVDEKGGRIDVSGPTIESRLSAPELIDRLQVNTREGRDRVYVEAAARALIDVLVDLGPGQS
jgi:Ca2+-binding RTX toxin-like protein